jgi:hypothetical protein
MKSRSQNKACMYKIVQVYIVQLVPSDTFVSQIFPKRTVFVYTLNPFNLFGDVRVQGDLRREQNVK